jgi:arsenate reductase-like glutaredoxin family protein
LPWYSQHKTLDVVTLFHKPSLASSVKVHALLKQASAVASEHATEDQASDHTAQTHPTRQPFELNITEDPPTSDQLKSILEYVGAQRAGTIVKGAKDEADALRKLKENANNFQRPVVSSDSFLLSMKMAFTDLLKDCRLEQWKSNCGG